MRRVPAAPGLVALLAALTVLVCAAPSALAHGEEGEAAAHVPARTLVQQALALLTQQENNAEAQEKLEQALESEDRKNVEIPAVRDALAALEDGDHELAAEQMKVALGAEEEAAAEEEPREPSGKQPEQEAGAAHEEGGVPAREEVPEEALEHASAFEPDRGSAEWIALAVGVALVITALGVLSVRRFAG